MRENLVKEKLCNIVCDELESYIMITDSNFNIVLANKRFLDDFGDISDKKCHEILHNTPEPPEYCPIIKGGERCQIYNESTGKWYKSKVKPTIVDGEKLYVHFIQDVTEKEIISENFKKLIELCPDIIVVHDGKKILFVNSAIERIAGIPREKIIGRNVFEFMHPDYKKIMKERIAKALKGERLPTIEEKIVLFDGREVIIEVGGGQIVWNNKPAIALFIKDITERKKFEKLYYELWDSISDGIVILSREGTIIDLNSRVEEISGYTREELIGVNISEIIDKRYADSILEALRSLFVTGKLDNIEVPLKLRKGEIWVEARGKIVEYKGSKVAQISLRDITERKELENKLKNERELFNRIVESMNVLVVGLDSEGQIVLFNRKCEDVFGVRKEEVVGKKFLELFIDTEYWDKFDEMMKKAKKGQDVEITTPVVTFSGNRRYISWTATFVSIGRRRLYILTGSDVTEELNYRRKVEEYAEIIKLVNKIMRHDLLNSLTVIDCALDVYRETQDESLLERISATTSKSINLIRNMQRLEKFMAQENKLKPISVRSVLEKIIGEYDVEFEIKGDCVVLADETLQSVLDNIIRNAIVHGKTEKITIEMKEEGEYAEVRITDYGVGIPPEIVDKIFEEGFSMGNGSGLGLYIVKKVMEKYGGAVWVEQGNGKTTFVLRFKTPAKLALRS